MPDIDLARPVGIALARGAWNMVLAVLGERPWREVNPLISEIRRQLQEAANGQIGQQGFIQGGNGDARMEARQAAFWQQKRPGGEGSEASRGDRTE